MSKHILLEIFIIITLLGVATAVRLWPSFGVSTVSYHDLHYGVYEGREVVTRTFDNGKTLCIVEDSAGHELFAVPVHNCFVAYCYRSGKLWFKSKTSTFSGYIDRNGAVCANGTGKSKQKAAPNEVTTAVRPIATAPAATATTAPATAPAKSTSVPHINLHAMARQGTRNPFAAEASKILKGKLSETDAANREVILNYCEHFRAAYPTRDIDFLRQIFSDQALIIVGNVCRTRRGADPLADANTKVRYSMRTKREYLAQLSRVFAANKRIDVTFSDFHIYRHPTMEGIYGVVLRQQYRSDRYADDGYLFLLWDFRNRSMPLIHVRTWQPAGTVRSADDIISLSDFNLD